MFRGVRSRCRNEGQRSAAVRGAVTRRGWRGEGVQMRWMCCAGWEWTDCFVRGVLIMLVRLFLIPRLYS